MQLTCPACNKANQTEAVCARCGCDLTDLRAVVTAAGMALAQGRAALAAQDWADALAQAKRSWQLCHSAEAARLGCLASGALGQTAVFLSWRGRLDRGDAEVGRA